MAIITVGGGGLQFTGLACLMQTCLHHSRRELAQTCVSDPLHPLSYPKEGRNLREGKNMKVSFQSEGDFI